MATLIHTLWPALALATPPDPGSAPPAIVIEIEGAVLAAPAGATAWTPARTNQWLNLRDRLRTRELSRAALRLRDRSLFRLGEFSEFTVESTDDPSSSTVVNLLRGVLLFLHRGNPRDVQLRTRTVSAAIRGTEFHVEVADNGRTVLTLFDGDVELSNLQGTLRLISGEQASIEPGQAPVKTPLLTPRHDLIQWSLHYPGVLDVAELTLAPSERLALEPSLAAYRQGDLLTALGQLPGGYQPVSDSARVYVGAVLLAVGKVDTAWPLLNSIPADGDTNPDRATPSRLASALRQMIALVKGTPGSRDPPPGTRDPPPSCATEELVDSYRHQATGQLAAALASARKATAISPAFAFAWTRVAELEFSFGRRQAAERALARSLALAPRNAAARTLEGFLLAADDNISAALKAFDEAIATDGALANAWLGRGLCRIRRGQLVPGRDDLQAAALLEPQRALLRSYLGKAWNELGDLRRAEAELGLAREADPGDPTAFLYLALLLQEENRITEAIRALERSQTLNDHRRIYRSRLLLDQDQAVRGANLATIYRDAGMSEWGVREAGLAVNTDYANPSAHLFLANSYNELRDPLGVNLRYETAWHSEHLVANLLAPVGGGALSPTISQLEYSRLLDRQRLSLASASEYLSRGAWAQQVAHSGRLPTAAYALEFDYLKDPGQRKGQHVEDRTTWATLQQQVSGADTILLQAQIHDVSAGDLNQYERPENINQTLRVREEQEPILLAGWHRAWAPGSHTLGLAAAGTANQDVANESASSYLLRRGGAGIELLAPMPFAQLYESRTRLLSGELQQIQQAGPHILVGGARWQAEEFRVHNDYRLTGRSPYDFVAFNFANPEAQSVRADFQRQTAYAYDYWQVLETLLLTGGLAYDRIEFPANHRFGPVSGRERTDNDWHPKLGLIWNPQSIGTLRLGWARARSGVGLEQNFRLEPAQIAGVVQAYRSILPESRVAANAGTPQAIAGVGWERRWGTNTYSAVAVDLLASDGNRHRGAYDWLDSGAVVPSSLRERLEYKELSFRAGLDRLIGDHLSVGAHYQWTRANLRRRFPGLPAFLNSDDGLDGELTELPTRRHERGDLHRLNLRARAYLPGGWLLVTEGDWWGQHVLESGDARTDTSFWQWHLTGGWRSPRRRFEANAGVLNLLEANGNVHPINLHATPPLERTFVARLLFRF